MDTHRGQCHTNHATANHQAQQPKLCVAQAHPEHSTVCASPLFHHPASPSRRQSPPTDPLDASRTPSRNSSLQLGDQHVRRVANLARPTSATAAGRPYRCCQYQCRAPASSSRPTRATYRVSGHPLSADASHQICSRGAPRTDLQMSQSHAHRLLLPTLHPSPNLALLAHDSTYLPCSLPADESS